MADAQTVERDARGIFTHHNPQNEAPPGAFLVADNAVIDREGVVSNRRGFNRYGDALNAPAEAIMEYQGKIVVLDETTLKHDSDDAGTWSNWGLGATYSPPDSSTRMRHVEANENFYFTTSKGVFRNDKLTGTILPRKAGAPKGLDIEAALTGTGDGWFTPDGQVGYRVAWSYKDNNGNLVIGAPSQRLNVTNALAAVIIDWAGGEAIVEHESHGYTTGDIVSISGTNDDYDGSHTITVQDADHYIFELLSTPDTTADVAGFAGRALDVALTFTIPEDLGVVDIEAYQIYRTEISADATVTPGDELKLVYETELTLGQISAGYVDFTDTYDPVFLGERLHTNATLEGSSQSNDRPPWCRFVAEFGDHVFYFYTKVEHELELKLIRGTTDLTGLAFTISDGTNSLVVTFAAAEDTASDEALWSTAETTEAGNIEQSCRSIIRVINRSENSYWYAEYLSGDDDEPGKIRVWAREYDDGQFHVKTSDEAVKFSFTPRLPSGTTLTSDNSLEPNAARRSKANQPDHVPRLNNEVFGSRSKAILGVVATDDDLLVFKQDGVFRLSGRSDGSAGFGFVVTTVDPSLVLRAINSLVLLDGSAFGFTSQGVTRTTGDGPAIVSRPVENELERVSEFTNFETLAAAIGHEKERKYLLATPKFRGGAVNEHLWCYNYLTKGGAWTRWRKKVRLGRELSTTGRLFLAHAVDSYILKERKDGTPSDYQDETIDATVTATGTTTDADGNTVSTVTITYTYSEALTDGWLLEQGTHEGIVRSVAAVSATSFTLTLDRLNASITTGACTVTMPIDFKIQWKGEDANNVGARKRFPYVQIYFEDGGSTYHELNFQSDFQDDIETTDKISLPRTRGWGTSKWGTHPWGDAHPRGQILRTKVPRNHSRGTALKIGYHHRVAKEKVSILQLSVDFIQGGSRTQRNPR